MFSDILANQDLPPGYRLRFMVPDDCELGVLDVLRVLTTVGQITQQEFAERVRFWQLHNDSYFPLVIIGPNRQVVACGMLFVERKLIHELGKVGHIEDISVAKSEQGLSLGRRLISALTAIASRVGCYKVILDCDEKNVGFYEKCGYKRAGVEMQLRF